MKRLFVLIGLVLLVSFVQAQDRTVTRTFQASDSYFKYVGQTQDTVGPTVDSLAVDFVVNKDYLVLYSIYNDVDVTSAGDSLRVLLQAKIHDEDSWTSIDSVGYYGSADTTWTFSQTSTPQAYRQFRLFYHRVGGQYEVQKINFKIWRKDH